MALPSLRLSNHPLHECKPSEYGIHCPNQSRTAGITEKVAGGAVLSFVHRFEPGPRLRDGAGHYLAVRIGPYFDRHYISSHSSHFDKGVARIRCWDIDVL